MVAGIDDTLDTPPSPETRRLAELLANAFGPATLAIIHYGSRAHECDPRPDSSDDFFVIVDDYESAFRQVHAAARSSFSPATATMLAQWLPPNVIALSVPSENGARSVKCVVLDDAHFRMTTSAAARDHFVAGRLFQFVEIAWTRDASARDFVRATLVATRRRTFEWVQPWLPPRFTVEEYFRTLLDTSFAWEIRPEVPGRVAGLVAAQLPRLGAAYTALLEEQVQRGTLTMTRAGEFSVRRPADPASLRRVRRYFHRSKRRSTLRWVKYVVLYDDWLDYVVRKVERRTGTPIALTSWERRWPLVFLWPRAIRFVLERPQRRNRSDPTNTQPLD
jgi:hypothetical protein